MSINYEHGAVERADTASLSLFQVVIAAHRHRLV